MKLTVFLLALMIMYGESFSLFPRFVKRTFLGRSRVSNTRVVPSVADNSQVVMTPKRQSTVKTLNAHSRTMAGTEYKKTIKTVNPSLSDVDTAKFGHDDSMDAYKSEMLDLVYERSLHRLGLD